MPADNSKMTTDSARASRRDWLLAIALFLSGANVIGLVAPFSLVVFVGFLTLNTPKEMRFSRFQMLVAGLASLTCLFGIAHADGFSDLSSNARQLAVIVIALLVAALLGAELEEVLERYFRLFTYCTLVGLVFYAVAPDFYVLSYSIDVRQYLIGPSSQLLDSGFPAFSLIGPYRFQGLFEEPATFSVFSAAAIYWAFKRRRLWAAVILIVATVLSESVGGILVLAVLVAWDWVSRSNGWRRLIRLAMLLAALAMTQAVDLEAISDTLAVSDLLENKASSGQFRVEQLNSIIASWENLVLPSGFSTTEVLKVSEGSLTAGYARDAVAFGFVIGAVMLGMILVGAAKINLDSASSILFLSLVVAGSSRSGVLDFFIGWLLLFYLLASRSSCAARKLRAPAFGQALDENELLSEGLHHG